MEIVKATKEIISKSQNRQKEAYDKKKVQKKYKKNLIYTVGQEVLLFNMRKQGRKGGRTEPDFNVPYTIQAISGKLVTLLNSEGVLLKNKYNVDHIKPFPKPKKLGQEGS